MSAEAIPMGRSELAVVLDRLEALDTKVTLVLGEAKLSRLWLSKAELAERLGVSVRYLEKQLADGCPHRVIAGKVRLNEAVVEGWLRKRGLLREVGT